MGEDFRCVHRSHRLRIKCLRGATYGRWCEAHNGCDEGDFCLPLPVYTWLKAVQFFTGKK